MAYEASENAYYMGHPEQNAPVRQQDQYGEYAHGGCEQDYGQHYDQGYIGGYEQHDQNAYMNQPRGQTHDDRYGAGYQQEQRQPSRPPNGGYRDGEGYQQQQPSHTHPRNGGHQAQQQDERSYDARHQQRPQKNGHGHGQQPGQRPQQQQLPQQHPAEKQGYQMQPQIPHRPIDSRNGNPPGKPENCGQQSGNVMSPHRLNGHEGAPQSQVQIPRKTAMEEWKAKEKVKMHANKSPEERAQDNAFPTFPNTKKERRQNESRSGASAMRHRSSEEQSRPSTSSSRPSLHGQRDQRPDVSQGRPSTSNDRPDIHSQHEQRPEMPHSNSYARSMHTDSSRPSLDHKQYPFESAQGGQQQPPPSSYGRRPSAPSVQPQAQAIREHQQMNGGQASSSRQPASNQQYQQRPSPPEDSRGPPRNQQVMERPFPTRQQSNWQGNDRQEQPERRSPPNAQAPQYYADDGSRYGNAQNPPQQAQRQPPPTQHARPGTAPSQRPPPPIDVTASRAPQMPASMNHQPLSPAYVPDRPSTSHAKQMPFNPQGHDSYSQYPPAATLPPQVQARNVGQLSLGNLHDGYNNYDDHILPITAAAVAPASAALSRDDEIEAEMPDFDSAAPSQTSMLHKRNQTVDRHLNSGSSSVPPPPMPAMPDRQANSSVQSLPVQKTRMQPPQHQQHDSYLVSLPQQQTPAAEFDFGLSQQDASYSQVRQPQRQGSGYDKYATPQPPFTSQAPPRRSMDDARQIPYRQGPTQLQQFYGNGTPLSPPPNGQFDQVPLVPQQRPGMNRNYSEQTTWSDPGQQRILGGPPLRQGLQALPGPGNGMPLPEQRPAPGQQQVNPDALPHHPAPVRPGLTESSVASPPKPPPVRNYGNAPASTPSISAHNRAPSMDHSVQPVTKSELERLHTAVTANPNSLKQSLLYAKKLVEAASVLASDGGRADAKTTAKNRERYTMDAYKRVKKLAALNFPEAQFYLADCYGQGLLGLEPDLKEAFNFYQAAAKQGHPEAAYRTAVCCEIGPEDGGGTRKDLPKAVQWYRRAAALGDVAAMYKLGVVLLKGLLGQQKNIAEALTWLKRSAERANRDHPHALHELATLYEPSNTNPEVRNKIIANEKYALELYQQASALGYKFSQFRVGQAYEYGDLGLLLDHRSSIQYYSKAAAQGEHQAELALSGWYLTGSEGILEQSDTEAYLWARKAASSEPPLAKAMFAMGYFSEQGIGCQASLEDARRWYGRAASYKFPKALERLEELKRSGKTRVAPVNGKLARKDQKRDEQECVVM